MKLYTFEPIRFEKCGCEFAIKRTFESMGSGQYEISSKVVVIKLGLSCRIKHKISILSEDVSKEQLPCGHWNKAYEHEYTNNTVIEKNVKCLDCGQMLANRPRRSKGAKP